MTRRSQILWITLGVIAVAMLSLGVTTVASSESSASITAATNGSITVTGSLNVGFGEGVTASGPPILNPSFDGPPNDPDGDGTYEDLNGNGRTDFDDIVQYFRHIREPVVTDYVSAYDFNSNGRIDFDDIVTLFEEI